MPETLDDRAALDDFMSAYSYPAQDGLIVKRVADHRVHARPHRGTAAAYFSFEDLHALEAHISELPPGGSTKMHRHACEALFYVLAGRGHSLVRREGGAEQQVQWEAGDLFFTPISVWHKHVNSDPEHPPRYLEITTLPLMKSIGAWSIETAPAGVQP